VQGSHLALPLLAGVARESGWDVEVWDLSERFYHSISVPPGNSALKEAVRRLDFSTLDNLYFSWEDVCSSRLHMAGHNAGFGLLSGVGYPDLRQKPLSVISELTRSGTIFTSFFASQVLSALVDADPAVVGLTIASEEQIIPAVELLQLVRDAVPTAFLVLGGNVVTRLRDSPAFAVLRALVDQVVVFQGEIAFRRILNSVDDVGVEESRNCLPMIGSDESIPYAQWPVPAFSGINLGGYLGIPALSYVSTRGCYWGKCHFCAIPAGWSSGGYGGSAPAPFVVNQLRQMAEASGICRIKFVDEAIPPRKVREIAATLQKERCHIEWEAYARLEPAWEDSSLLAEARSGGLRKLYLGLEQAPTTDRVILGKNDRGNPVKILRACMEAGIKVHLFCMVGHPGSTIHDAESTVAFLLDNEGLIDTADLVAFRLDRGTRVPGVRAVSHYISDWALSLPFEPTGPSILRYDEVSELEVYCQEKLWAGAPRLLHPLYRVISPWGDSRDLPKTAVLSAKEDLC
jgi:hypothetical protein